MSIEINSPGCFIEEAVMGDFHLLLNPEEKDYLLGLLQTRLTETRVEVHRTHTPGFREKVIDEEKLVRELLAKIQKPGD
jgi:hypothetical protein